MIFEAIAELNEEDGSSENSISKYIVSNFDDLPWAHRRYLSHHLNNLYRNGELAITASRRYTIPGFVADSTKRRRGRLKSKGGKQIWDHDDTGEVNLVKWRENMVIENQSAFSEDVVGERQVKHKRRSLIILEEEEEPSDADVAGVQELDVSTRPEIQETEGQDRQIEKGGEFCEGGTENIASGLDLQVAEVCEKIEQEKGSVSGDKEDGIGVSEIKKYEEQHQRKEQQGHASGNETEGGVPRSETFKEQLLLEEQPDIITHEQYLLENGKNVDAEGKLDPQQMNGKKSVPEEYQVPVATEILLLDYHQTGTELMVVPSTGDMKPQAVEVKKRRVLERINCELVCGLPVSVPERPKCRPRGSSQKVKFKCRQAEPTTSTGSPTSSKLPKPEQLKRKRQCSSRGKKLKNQTGESAVASPDLPMKLLEYDKEEYTSLEDVKIKFNRLLPESLSLVEKAGDKAMDGKEAQCFGAETTLQKLVKQKAFDSGKPFLGPIKMTQLFGQSESRGCVNPRNFDVDEASVTQQKRTLHLRTESSNCKLLKFTTSQPPYELKLPIRETFYCSLEQKQEQKSMQTEPQDLRSLVGEPASRTPPEEPMPLQLQRNSQSKGELLSGAEEPKITEDEELHAPFQEVLSSSGQSKRFASQLATLQTGVSPQTLQTEVETQLSPSEMTTRTTGRIGHISSCTKGQLHSYEQASSSAEVEALTTNENSTIPSLPSVMWSKKQESLQELGISSSGLPSLPIPGSTSELGDKLNEQIDDEMAQADLGPPTAAAGMTTLPSNDNFQRNPEKSEGHEATASVAQSISFKHQDQKQEETQVLKSPRSVSLTSYTVGPTLSIDNKIHELDEEVVPKDAKSGRPIDAAVMEVSSSARLGGIQDLQFTGQTQVCCVPASFPNDPRSGDSQHSRSSEEIPKRRGRSSGNLHFQALGLRPKCRLMMRPCKVQAAANSITAIPDSLQVQHQENESEVGHLDPGQARAVHFEGTTSENIHHLAEEPKRRGRGRPPKRRRDLLHEQHRRHVLVEPTEASRTGVVSSGECQHRKEQEELVQKHEEILHSELEPTGDSGSADRFISKDQYRVPSKDDQKLQEKRRRRGRPPKPKPVVDGTVMNEMVTQNAKPVVDGNMENVEATQNAKPAVDGNVENEVATQKATEQPRCRGRGRPPKQKDAAAVQVSVRSKPEVPVCSKPLLRSDTRNSKLL